MARRVTASEVNWAFILETLQPHDKSRVISLKTATDKYLRGISTRPADLPKIDWNSYKSKIAVPGMVDAFQKAYEALKVPYPPDQGALAEAEKLNSELMTHANKMEEEVIKTSKELKLKLQELEKVMKYSEMTVEEYLLARPEKRNDYDNPKMWPQGLPYSPNRKIDSDH